MTHKYRSKRYHGFDLLRGTAMLLGIVIHAPLVYVDRSVGRKVLPEFVNLPELQDWIGIICLWINSWRMPVFFLMAGFMSILVIGKIGPRFYLKDRFLRVGCSMILFGFFLIGYPSNNILNLGHFWFLYCLIVIIFIFAISSFFIPILNIEKINLVTGWVFLRPRRLILLLMVFVLVRLLCSYPYNGNLPLPDNYAKFIFGTFFYYCFWFYIGVGLYYAKSQIPKFASFKVISILGILAIFSMCLAAFTIDTFKFFVTPESLNERHTYRFFFMNVYWASTTFCWTFFLTFLFHRILNRGSIFVSWLVELSYPIYIFHLSVAIFISAELIKAGFGQAEVFLVTIPTTFLLCLLLYYAFIKFTPLNWLVNGYEKSWFKIPKFLINRNWISN